MQPFAAFRRHGRCQAQDRIMPIRLIFATTSAATVERSMGSEAAPPPNSVMRLQAHA